MTGAARPHAVTAVAFEALAARDLAALAALSVTPDQEEFGGSFDASLAEWRTSEPRCLLGLAFLRDEMPIGLVLLKRPPLSPDWVARDAVSLHGFKIATPYQGGGLGWKALECAVETVSRHWSDARRLCLAVDAENAAALALYRGAGMQDSGAAHQGRIGVEYRLSLTL
ncbi:GNAT family N-acetyltransferase [Dinoroseobacter sp. S375]|uniref:GNAT family N-acetyltransferase n=1 Tax=Dinoroseobacter sp. S375 TaxID=3415136 RepID=UPI003C7A2A9B